ncbi:MAG: alanine--tRNA ligase [Patescibacteria group bacterium]
MVSTAEIRNKYLEFFKSKGHTIIPSASLIPENDPTVLFTTAGMHPLVPYLLGEAHPGGSRVTSVQKCIRTGDIDEVGDVTHLTFFEMLGNWSFGDYFKNEAIEMSFEFLTSKEWLGLDKNLLAVSVFQGDKDAPLDTEAFEKWKSLGISEKRIAKLPKKNNWWGPAGETGPCGPDTEMFYWTGKKEEVPDSFNDDNPLWVEIWNDVFMQYFKNADGTFKPLEQKNVDTGMGLERTVAILNGVGVYEIDSFKPIIERIEQLSGKKYGENAEDTRAIRIIADHVRAATFVLGDQRGIAPSNIGQGYVLRRLIRRAIRYGKLLGVHEAFTASVAEDVILACKDAYPELAKNHDTIIQELSEEEKRFSVALDKGLKEFGKLTSVDGKEAFNLYQSYGFPIELTEELSKEKGFVIDKKLFTDEFKKHQELSRTSSAGVFKGGLADNSEEVTKYHTTTHLLHQALRDVLGSHVEQKGSNLTKERLRFDFSHNAKMTLEEIAKVEQIVNDNIKKDLPVHFEMLTIEEAKKAGAIGLFEDKYAKLGNKIKVYFIGDYSREICGGPHVEHTGEIHGIKIQKEEAVSAGVRRIRAVLQ